MLNENEMKVLTQLIEREGIKAMPAIEEALGAAPEDARLFFLKGSLLASNGQHIAAHAALQRAVDLEPEFSLARYQLGFFQLTSGEVNAALSTWGPLDRLDADHYLRAFVEGMRHLIRDDFQPAIERLRAGIELNTENEPLNDDVRLLLSQIDALLAKERRSDDPDDDFTSSETSFLLGQTRPFN